MVLLLNLIPFGLAVAICFCLWRKHFRTAMAIAILCSIYSAAIPSYMPKGVVHRSDVPQFEPSSAVINDNNRKPDYALSERTEMMEKRYKDGLSFIEDRK